MVGRAESLNVSVSTAVVCFEALRQRRLDHGARRRSAGDPVPRPTMPGMDRSPVTPDEPMGGGRAGGTHDDRCPWRSTSWSRRPGPPWPPPTRPRPSAGWPRRSPARSRRWRRRPGPSVPSTPMPVGRPGSDCTRRARPSRRSSRNGGARSPASELAREMAESRIDLTEFIAASHDRASGPGPSPPGVADPRRARGRLRGHGLRSGRGPGDRDRLVQLRGPQHPARPSGAEHVGHLLPQPRAPRRRPCSAPTPRRCRST